MLACHSLYFKSWNLAQTSDGGTDVLLSLPNGTPPLVIATTDKIDIDKVERGITKVNKYMKPPTIEWWTNHINKLRSIDGKANEGCGSSIILFHCHRLFKLNSHHCICF